MWRNESTLWKRDVQVSLVLFKTLFNVILEAVMNVKDTKMSNWMNRKNKFVLNAMKLRQFVLEECASKFYFSKIINFYYLVLVITESLSLRNKK
jgi:hypothetical protein